MTGVGRRAAFDGICLAKLVGPVGVIIRKDD